MWKEHEKQRSGPTASHAFINVNPVNTCHMSIESSYRHSINTDLVHTSDVFEHLVRRGKSLLRKWSVAPGSNIPPRVCRLRLLKLKLPCPCEKAAMLAPIPNIKWYDEHHRKRANSADQFDANTFTICLSLNGRIFLSLCVSLSFLLSLDVLGLSLFWPPNAFGMTTRKANEWHFPLCVSIMIVSSGFVCTQKVNI